MPGNNKSTCSSLQSMETGIRIVEVRVRNFRSLRKVDLKLDRITVLIGENNSGKTSLLEALYCAIGGVRRGLTPDDIFVSGDELSPPKDRSILVDVLILPTDDAGKRVDAFPSGNYWTSLFGKGIQQDADDNDFVGIRTVLQWNDLDAEYRVERRFLKEWREDSSDIKFADVDQSQHVSPTQIDPIALYLMDAKRDIEDDMRRQRSVWGRLISNLGLADDLARDIEKALTDLNTTMIEGSEVLKHLGDNLQILNSLVAGDDEGVKISPVSRSIRDLSKGINLDFTSKGSQTFPLARHGMGTKSLAAVLVFRAFVSWRVKQSKSDRIHPTLGLEEPEAHLHPQAQRALISQISEIPGQVIVSTHSPYVAAQVSIESLRHFGKNCAESLVTQVDTSNLSEDDIDKIDRLVMNTRGEVLFSRALIISEGATEEFALPVFASSWWGKNAHMCGFSFIGVGGDGNYLPFLRMAIMCQIPWYILADGEEVSVDRLKKQLKKIGIDDLEGAKNVQILPGGNNFERYLVSEKYEDAIGNMLDEYHGEQEYLKQWITTMDGQPGKKGAPRDYKGTDGHERAMADCLMSRKVGYGKLLADKIVGLGDEKRRYPFAIQSLFQAITDEQGLARTKVKE